MPAFENERRQSGTRQIRGRGESVVAAPNHDRVVTLFGIESQTMCDRTDLPRGQTTLPRKLQQMNGNQGKSQPVYVLDRFVEKLRFNPR